MKLSLKLQDEPHQNPPILKAKIPITIFNQPFISSLTTTANSATPQDLSFSLSTNFSSGPSLRLTYTPVSTTTTTTTATAAAATSPFSLSLKSGLGLFGSPHDSPLSFSAHFSLSATNSSPVTPSFFLHFKPQFGNFSLHKTTSSSNPSPIISRSRSVSGDHLQSGSSSNSEFANGSLATEASGWQDLKLEACNANENGFANFNPSFHNGVDSSNGIGFVKERAMVWRDGKKGGFLTGIAVKANTVLPVTKGIMVNLRWGVNFPADSEVKLPYLTVNKIGIERVEKVEVEKKKKKVETENNAGDLDLLKGMCFWMRRDLEVLEKENRDMKQCLEEMRMGVSARSYRRGSDDSGKKIFPSSSESSGEFERWRDRKNSEGNAQTELKKSVTVSQANDLESQLQKAIKAASS